MKRLSYCALIIALLSATAFAEKKTQTVKFTDAVKVGATQLPAGSYKVSWEGTGSNIQVTLEQKGVEKPATVTTTAKVVEQKNNHSSFVVDTKDGVNVVEGIDFNKFSLTFTPAPAQGQ